MDPEFLYMRLVARQISQEEYELCVAQRHIEKRFYTDVSTLENETIRVALVGDTSDLPEREVLNIIEIELSMTIEECELFDMLLGETLNTPSVWVVVYTEFVKKSNLVNGLCNTFVYRVDDGITISFLIGRTQEFLSNDSIRNIIKKKWEEIKTSDYAPIYSQD